jgi:hypothetical protein
MPMILAKYSMRSRLHRAATQSPITRAWRAAYDAETGPAAVGSTGGINHGDKGSNDDSSDDDDDDDDDDGANDGGIKDGRKVGRRGSNEASTEIPTPDVCLRAE